MAEKSEKVQVKPITAYVKLEQLEKCQLRYMLGNMIFPYKLHTVLDYRTSSSAL